jgi:hypothetical protein
MTKILYDTCNFSISDGVWESGRVAMMPGTYNTHKGRSLLFSERTKGNYENQNQLMN